jgi:predicted LPLAT superfamily acyltransferase
MIGGLYYRVLTVLSGWGGLWLFRMGAWFVAAGYYLFFPRRVTASAAFYRALQPGRSSLFYRACAWRQFQRFTGVFLDRFLLQSGQPVTCTSEGLEHLDAALGRGSGGILLMSHVGNWEIAAHMLRRHRRHLPLLLYMGARQKEQIEKLQKAHLAESGIRIIVAGESAATPYDTVDGIQHLKKGGLVSLAGDMVWHTGQRTLPVRFLGRQVHLPAGPHVFALLTGAPLFYFFSYRTGPRSHHFTVSQPMFVAPSPRARRQATLQASAQAYADCLEAHARRHPFDWFHFRPLWDTISDA